MIMQNIYNEKSQYLHIGNDDDWIVNVMITTMIAMAWWWGGGWSYRLLWWSPCGDLSWVLFVLYFADYNYSTSSSSYLAIIIGVLGLLVAIIVPAYCIRLKKARDMQNQNRVVTYRRNQQPKVVHHYHQGKSSRCLLTVRRCLLCVRKCFLSERGCLLSVRGCLLFVRGCLLSVRGCLLSERGCL